MVIIVIMVSITVINRCADFGQWDTESVNGDS
uniref:Uncharacterized protein n=1 Tax=Anguilla anguilla TaxID=7936 RepID=A0A0E9PMI3_ANGAN